MKTFRLAVIFLLVLGEPAFSTPVQTGHGMVPEQAVRLVLSPQPARWGMRQNSARSRFMAILSEVPPMSRADGFCEVKTIALMCTSRAPNAISRGAAESQNADALRDIHNPLFDTSHPKRIAVVEQWYQEMPNSRFALSAATWVAINKVERFGDEFRAYHSPNSVPRARRLQWIEFGNHALEMANEALEQADGYVPALDAWLLTRQLKRRRGSRFNEVSAALMRAAPDRTSVLRIVASSYARPAHSSEDVLRACLAYAETAVDYNVDACVIEASIKYPLRDDLRQLAMDMVITSEDAMFADERLRVMLWQRDLDQAAKDQLVDLHRNLPFDETDPLRFMREAIRVSFAANSPEYRTEFRAKTLSYLTVLLADDPFNHVLLWKKAEMHLEVFGETKDRAKLTKAQAAWQDAMVFGGFNSMLWHLGTRLAETDLGPEGFAAQQVFFENAIAHQEQSILYVLYYFDFMQTARDAAEIQVADHGDASGDAAAFLERLKCPQLKAARSAFAQCRVTDAAMGLCDPTRGYYEHVPQVLAEGAAGSCPAITDLPLSDLQYSATPLDAINLPWSTPINGQD